MEHAVDIEDSPNRSFDRTKDVSKIIGCNTRNVPYRWSIFETHLREVPAGSHVLDFGAGALRETWEMARRGYQVTAVDLDAKQIADYCKDYDWRSGIEHDPQFDIRRGLAGHVPPNGGYKLALAFDVFEHLSDPASLLNDMYACLSPGGLVFCTVPNCLTLSEVGFRVGWKINVATKSRFSRSGRLPREGEPHIQFKTPGQWRRLFTTLTPFEIADHDLQIGCFANTWFWTVRFSGLLFGVLSRKLLRTKKPKVSNHHVLCHPRLMSCLHGLDTLTRPAMRAFCAWNLFVLRKPNSAANLSFPRLKDA